MADLATSSSQSFSSIGSIIHNPLGNNIVESNNMGNKKAIEATLQQLCNKLPNFSVGKNVLEDLWRMYLNQLLDL